MSRTSLYTSLVLITGATACISDGCNTGRTLITIPCRTCIVRGSDLSKATAVQRDDAVQDAYNYINQNIWKQADILFLGCCQEIPVIEDPDIQWGHEGNIALGMTRILPSKEMEDAAEACAQAWAAKTSLTGEGIHFTEGPIVIIARDVTGVRGVYVEDLGITDPRPGTADLCSAPRLLTAQDVFPRYSIITEQARYGPRGDQHNWGNMRDVLAHELGHQVLLDHGNGLDDDANGTLPPAAGKRLFDSHCDFAESSGDEARYGSGSLMGAMVGSTVLTPLQVELARDAARAWPGHSGN